MAATAGAYGSPTAPTVATPTDAMARPSPGSLGLVGVMTVLVAAWAGIAPFVGPTFGYSIDGKGSFTWNLAHSLLALAPGAVGVVAGLAILGALGRASRGFGPSRVAAAGTLAALAGGWVAVGPFAWPALYHSTYFVHASAFRMLTYVAGSSVGPGLLLAAFGGIALGWALCTHGATMLSTVPRGAPMAPVSSFPNTAR